MEAGQKTLKRVDRQFRLARMWSNSELRKIDFLFKGDIVNVSGGEDIDKEGNTYATYFPNKNKWYLTNYAAGSFRGFQGRENEFQVDLTAALPPELEQRFDVAFNHTTLEHIFDVRKAFANLCRMSMDVVIVVVPFCQVQHESSAFNDYWRFTPTCIRELFRENEFDVIYEAESPDIDAAVYLLVVGSRNPDRWNTMPNWAPVEVAGDWIGKRRASLFQRIASSLGLEQLRQAIRGR